VKPARAIDGTRERLLAEGVVLCVRLGAGAPVLEACRAALRGGLRVLEITLTTPGALDAIAALAREPEALVGGGTVLEVEEVRAVAAAGGRFVFSPVFDPAVVDAAAEHGLLAVPGAATATEILAAQRHGAPIVKLFPAGALGGPAHLRALRGPLPDVPLLPTSGPTAESAAAWLEAGACAIGVGGEVFPAGFTLAHVERAAARVRAALDAARAGGAAPAAGPEPDVRVVPVPVPGGGLAHGVACRFEGGQYVALVARRGLVACGIFDLAVCERFGFAVAMAHGTPEAPLVDPADVLAAEIDSVSEAARALGVTPGMKGAEALARLG
jgi:2-dehydro-3-deoxyphosphogluconate aldolase/(4S)-4-hydroxy-2-oxoglutarate aldolase